MAAHDWTGWVRWNGGERPVAPDVYVRLRFEKKDYLHDSEAARPAGKWKWGHMGSYGRIIAYKVLVPEVSQDRTP